MKSEAFEKVDSKKNDVVFYHFYCFWKFKRRKYIFNKFIV